jgi:hypothetical protein
MLAHYGCVLHVQVGNNSCYGEFSDPNNQASSTWWISKTGVIEQYVDSDDAAWTEAAGNFTWDSVETEGEPTESLTDAQVLSLARIYVWGVQTYGWPLQLTDDPNGRGFIWHGAGGLAWGGHFSCPGDLRKAQRAGALFIASLVLHPADQPPPIQEGDMIARNTHGQGVWCVRKTGAIYAFGGAPDIGPSARWIKEWGIGTDAIPVVGIVDDGVGGFYLSADANQYPGVPAVYHITADGQFKV